MKENLQDQKRKVVTKYYEFEQYGLLKYRKYLDKEKAHSIGKPIKKAYLNYIEKEIVRADKRLEKLEEKLRIRK